MGAQHSRKRGCKLVYLAVYKSSLLLSSRGGKDMLKRRNVTAKEIEMEGARGKKGGGGTPEKI